MMKVHRILIGHGGWPYFRPPPSQHSTLIRGTFTALPPDTTTTENEFDRQSTSNRSPVRTGGAWRLFQSRMRTSDDPTLPTAPDERKREVSRRFRALTIDERLKLKADADALKAAEQFPSRRSEKSNVVKRGPRGLNGFNWFQAEYRASDSLKNLASSEVNRELSRRWRALSDEERQRYSDMADAARRHAAIALSITKSSTADSNPVHDNEDGQPPRSSDPSPVVVPQTVDTEDDACDVADDVRDYRAEVARLRTEMMSGGLTGEDESVHTTTDNHATVTTDCGDDNNDDREDELSTEVADFRSEIDRLREDMFAHHTESQHPRSPRAGREDSVDASSTDTTNAAGPVAVESPATAAARTAEPEAPPNGGELLFCEEWVASNGVALDPDQAWALARQQWRVAVGDAEQTQYALRAAAREAASAMPKPVALSRRRKKRQNRKKQQDR